MKSKTKRERQAKARVKGEKYPKGIGVTIEIPDISSNVDMRAFGDKVEKYFSKKVILDINYSNIGYLSVILNNAKIAKEA